MADQVVSDVVCEIHPRKVRYAGGIEISKVCSIAFVGGIKDIFHTIYLSFTRLPIFHTICSR